MTPSQRQTVNAHKAEGFEFILSTPEIVRMTRGADARVVMADGSQKRGYHVDMRKEASR